jgi:rSAM/selenodomain-associated transferase 1
MAKVPPAGQVKTRLQPFLSEQQCVELATCFIKDAVFKSEKVTKNVIVAFTPVDGRNELEQLLSENLILIEQTGNNLGERMQSAVEFAEKKGFSPIIVIGTDSPTFPPEYLQRSINLIENHQAEIVIGASADGGYYLIGFRNSVNGIFENIEWSSEQTLVQTIRNAQQILGYTPPQVPNWYDVDTPAELKILYNEFSENKEFKQIAPNTAHWLENNLNIFDCS